MSRDIATLKGILLGGFGGGGGVGEGLGGGGGLGPPPLFLGFCRNCFEVIIFRVVLCNHTKAVFVL